MTKHFLRIVGLALLWSVPFLGHTPTAATAGDATCCGNAGCESCCDCCPHCGCKLVPQCHITCTTKTVTTYKYTCKCEDMCVPGVTRICDKCGHCDGSGQCAENGCCEDCCKGCCKCRIHEVSHLMKIPCVKEVPIRKCTVEWVCPHCDCHGDCTQAAPPSATPSATPTVAPSAPLPPAPRPADKSAGNSHCALATIVSG
jgi:hypothetical protein